MNKTFDSLPSHYKYSDVSFTLLNATYKKETGDELSFSRDLFSMGLLLNNDQVTNAGLLLCDQGYLPQSKIVCTRWKGCEKGSVEGDALDDKVLQNSSIISLMENAESFIRTNSKNAWAVRGMRREEQSDYPYKAVREILVNALMHRDYQIVGTEIHIDMFDDRMEIMSPGGMFGGGRIQDLDIRNVPSMRRNEIIADMFDRLNYMERRGSGIGRVLNCYADNENKPVFFSTEYYFIVTLPNRSINNLKNIEKTQLGGEKTQLGGEKTQLGGEKTQLGVSFEKEMIGSRGVDWELNYFKDVILKEKGTNLRRKTTLGLENLFNKYRYEYPFNRRIVADTFGISENAASQMINKWIEKDIVTKVKKDEYCFKAD